MEKYDLKIGIIGHFGENENFTDGQTVKTKEVEKAINKRTTKRCDKFDTHKNSRNIFKLFFGVKRILKQNDVVIFLLSTRGYTIILPILIALNKIYNKKIFDFVIGTRYDIYVKNKYIKKIAKKIDKIYVETQSLKNKYTKLGITNVDILPNFKELKIYSGISEFKNKERLKVCTFTRVCKEKGIEDSVKAIEHANKELQKEVFSLDIYGSVDKKYIEEFENFKKQFPSYIKYKGIINPEKSSNIIKEYDLMLFLTYWDGEAFPGTVIDSFSAGVPVIATDWNCNFEILKENYTGIKTEIKNPIKTSKILLDCYNNQEKVYKMKENCINEAYKYMAETVINGFIKDITKVD